MRRTTISAHRRTNAGIPALPSSIPSNATSIFLIIIFVALTLCILGVNTASFLVSSIALICGFRLICHTLMDVDAAPRRGVEVEEMVSVTTATASSTAGGPDEVEKAATIELRGRNVQRT